MKTYYRILNMALSDVFYVSMLESSDEERNGFSDTKFKEAIKKRANKKCIICGNKVKDENMAQMIFCREGFICDDCNTDTEENIKALAEVVKRCLDLNKGGNKHEH